MVPYAMRSGGSTYHLVNERDYRTFCGLTISRIKQKGPGGKLFLSAEQPRNRSLCKHCKRIEAGGEEG